MNTEYRTITVLKWLCPIVKWLSFQMPFKLWTTVVLFFEQLLENQTTFSEIGIAQCYMIGQTIWILDTKQHVRFFYVHSFRLYWEHFHFKDASFCQLSRWRFELKMRKWNRTSFEGVYILVDDYLFTNGPKMDQFYSFSFDACSLYDPLKHLES